MSEESPDPERKRYFDEWCHFRLARLNIGFDRYATMRAEGEWAAFCERKWGRLRFDPSTLETEEG